MVGENFEIYTSEMAKNALEILHHGWRIFLKFTLLKWLKMHLKSSTMVGENFEVYTSEMAKNAVKIHHHGWRKF